MKRKPKANERNHCKNLTWKKFAHGNPKRPLVGKLVVNQSDWNVKKANYAITYCQINKEIIHCRSHLTVLVDEQTYEEVANNTFENNKKLSQTILTFLITYRS